MATLELDLINEDYNALTKVVGIEPKNKEIHKELGRVVLLLNVNVRSKRSIEKVVGSEHDRKRKKSFSCQDGRVIITGLRSRK